MTPAGVVFIVSLIVVIALTVGAFMTARRAHRTLREAQQLEPLYRNPPSDGGWDRSREPLSFARPAAKGFKRPGGGTAA